jgi:hypothetical protein
MSHCPTKNDVVRDKTAHAVDRLRIIVLGYMIRGPVGGFASYHLQYVKGLARLGHDVYFIEIGDEYPSCYHPSRNVTERDPTYGLEFATDVFKRAGLPDRWAYFDAHRGQWYGPCAARVPEIGATADLLLNVGSINPVNPWFAEVPARALVDLDPVFTQVKHITDASARARALHHTAFFTIGENFGLPHCSIPDDGLPWMSTRQPIVLDDWPFTPGPIRGKFTTVMQWESYPAREYDGIRYGVKADSFDPYLNFPTRIGLDFELAIGGPAVPFDLLRSYGWGLLNPLEVTQDPWLYQGYIQQSKAEFSVAKQAYVATWSGWFSDRSAAYLACGRPVLLQDTGYTDWIQCGAGIIPFSSSDEALQGVEDVHRRYDFHCNAARDIAKEYFDSRKVLSRLIERALNPASSRPRM